MAGNPAAPAPELQLATEKTATETIVHCTGRITSSTSALLRDTTRSLIPGAKRIVLDLTNVSYLDSSGLGALVSLYVSTRRASCELKLINLNQRIKELLRLTNLASILEGHEEYLGLTPD